MAWHDLVPALTPVVAYDATYSMGGRLLNRAGGAAAGVTANLNGQRVAVSGPRLAVIGSGARVEYSSAVPMPTNGLLIALVKPTGNIVLNTQAPGGNHYMLARNATKKWYMGGLIYGSAATPDDWQVVAVWWDTSNFRIYVNGDWADVAKPFAYKPSSLRGMVYGSGFYLNGELAAHGLFSGAATLADIQAIEAELWTLGLASGIGTAVKSLDAGRCVQHPLAQLPGPIPSGSRGIAALRRNIHFGGHGFIAGTVKEKGNPDRPLVRQVLLYSENTNMLVASTWSDAAGNYRFDNLDPAQRYTVISYDYKRLYRAVIADNLVPEKML